MYDYLANVGRKKTNIYITIRLLPFVCVVCHLFVYTVQFCLFAILYVFVSHSSPKIHTEWMYTQNGNPHVAWMKTNQIQMELAVFASYRPKQQKCTCAVRVCVCQWIYWAGKIFFRFVRLCVCVCVTPVCSDRRAAQAVNYTQNYHKRFQFYYNYSIRPRQSTGNPVIAWWARFGRIYTHIPHNTQGATVCDAKQSEGWSAKTIFWKVDWTNTKHFQIAADNMWIGGR